MLQILCDVYEKKNPEDLIILDNAHAHVAHLVVKEHFEGLKDIEGLLTKHGIHCDRVAGCDSTGGSLGHNIGIGIGLALVNADRQVHCIVSDGSMHEGSNWEALRIKHDLGLNNLKIYANFNGYSAVSVVNRDKLEWQMQQFCPDITVYKTENGEGFWGIQGHYKVL